VLKKNGLTSPSAHHPIEALEKNLSAIIDGAHVIGQKFIVCPYLDAKLRTAEGYKHFAEALNKAW
jgi:hypothetical protein